uniref:Chemokine interleukin-8-like domain-containing protein n=1 Tax=Electrophorus electricus TaxID=8005 RepID=A0AAY5ERJ0_ELEEL
MRNLCALLFVLLLCSLQLVSSAPLARSPNCCPSVTDKKIPLKKVVSYKHTDSDCAVKGIIFKMISGKEICVDPASDWVNDHMKAVDQRTVSTTGNPTSTPAT